jgi:hypothetical protein
MCRCAEDLIATALGQPSDLGFVLENGTDFSIRLQINPALPSYLISNATAQDIFVLYKQHNYTEVGEFSSTVKAWNKVSNTSAQCIVVVQKPITDLTVQVREN